MAAATASLLPNSMDSLGAVGQPAQSVQTSERLCENTDCNVNKLISMVPKRKTIQFISEPAVMEKPMLVNGVTAFFQVEGQSAKLMDIKNPNGETEPKTIYRVIPNTHVHVVNYVVVDDHETYIRKIKDNDPETMQKLLTSQKESADRMLRKIMSGQGSSTTTAGPTTTMITVDAASTTNQMRPPPGAAVGHIAGNMNKSSPLMKPSPATSNAQQISLNNSQSSIKLPTRVHPNLKITAVASVEPQAHVNSANHMSANTVTSTASSSPYITPVPLANLQANMPTNKVTAPVPAPIQTQTPRISSVKSIPATASPATAPTGMLASSLELVDKPTYDKMQQEINDLRRTVAMLAEAQSKSQTNSPAAVPKRPRLIAPK